MEDEKSNRKIIMRYVIIILKAEETLGLRMLTRPWRTTKTRKSRGHSQEEGRNNVAGVSCGRIERSRPFMSEDPSVVTSSRLVVAFGGHFARSQILWRGLARVRL